MSDSTHETQDQRNNNGTEDPNMTIEFLRARLLSERSVSRAARQRANELSKRVAELEEQLKIVSLQRKKAEKATVNVLAILENHGISDDSEEFDSSSDQGETFSESHNGHELRNGDETSTSIRVTDTPACSSSELESSPSTGRSLSWKNNKHSLRSFEQKNYIDSSRRKFTSFAPHGSSPKRIGKSCRRVRHGRRETRSAVEGAQKDSSIFHGDASTAGSEGLPYDSGIQPVSLEEGPCHLKESDPAVEVSPNQRQVADDHIFTENEGYEDMEGAMEHQEQLIGLYKMEEKAQREWEEKFAENNGRSPESCDPENHSDVTEERYDARTTGQPRVASAADAPNWDGKSEGADICSDKEVKGKNNLLLPPHIDTNVQERECNTKISRDSSEVDRFSLSRAIQHEVQPEDHNHASSSHSQFADSSKDVDDSSEKSVFSGNKLQVVPVTHETTDSVGAVLQALQQAKLSLKRNLDTPLLLQSISSGMLIESANPSTKTLDKVAIPPGCPGLFRLPIDMQFDTTSKGDYLGVAATRSSLASYYPKSSSFADEQYHVMFTSPAESTSVTHVKTPYEPILDAGYPSSTRLARVNLQQSDGLPFTSKPEYLAYRFCPDITSQLSFNRRLLENLDNNNVGVHLAGQLPLNNDHKLLLPRLSSSDDHNVGLPPSTRLSFYDHTNFSF